MRALCGDLQYKLSNYMWSISPPSSTISSFSLEPLTTAGGAGALFTGVFLVLFSGPLGVGS